MLEPAKIYLHACELRQEKGLSMFKALKARRAEKENAYNLYQALVTQARDAAFYTDLGVEDTVEGRFDMILLHVWLVDYRLAEAGESFVRLRRYIQETLVADMDRSFRELGVGDMSVGKEMKKVGAALLGRKASYTEALAAGSEALAAALVKNIYRGSEENRGNMLAKHVVQTVLMLNSQKCVDPASVSFEFPGVKTE